MFLGLLIAYSYEPSMMFCKPVDWRLQQLKFNTIKPICLDTVNYLLESDFVKTTVFFEIKLRQKMIKLTNQK